MRHAAPQLLRRTGAVTAIGRWSARHPWRAIALWLAFVVSCVGALALTGSKTLQNGAVGESARGYTLLDKNHVRGIPQFDYAYLHSDSLRVGAPAFRSAIADVRARMGQTLRAPVTVRVSATDHSALLTARATQEFGVVKTVLDRAARAHPQLTIGGDGPGSGGATSSNRDLHRAEKLALPVTLIVLLFAFGSVVAALVPLLVALTAVVATFGLLGPISHLVALDSSVKTIVLLIGMAVGVDYALFYVIRSREERRRGLSSHEALARAAATSGRTVVIAGTTVAIAMAGQFVIGSAIFNGIAAGTITVVACAVAASLTVLPAVLELLGPRLDRGRIPFLPHLRTDTSTSRFWPAVIARVLRRPVVSLLLGAGLLVALAIPALRLHVSEPDSDTLKPRSDSALLARMQAEFPSTSAPAAVVVSAPPVEQPRVRRELKNLERLAAARGVAHPPFAVNRSDDGLTTALALPLTGLGNNQASRNAIHVLRTQLIPQTLGRIHGDETAVTGTVAEDVDFTHQVKHGMPYVIAFVLALAFGLLLVTFRSVVVPLKAIVLNLLSVSAAYGVLVLVFRAPLGAGPARIPLRRGDHRLAAALPLRRALRPFDGLPRVHPQPYPRGVRRGDEQRRCRPLRHHAHGRGRHQRGARDGRRLLDLRHADRAGRQAGRRRSRGRRPHRRDDRPGCPAPRVDEAPRRLELVPAPLARPTTTRHEHRTE
jgi:uncharacterized membrane protein YdfJ with MMPL/SSD domain